MSEFLKCCEQILRTNLSSRGRQYIRQDWQLEAWKNILASAEASADSKRLGIVKAPTAAGKTEAVIVPYFAQYLLESWPIAPASIYVLPNQTLLRQVQAKLRALADTVSSISGSELEIHVNSDYGGVHHDKSFMAGDVVVTTLDSFIFGYLGARTIGDRITLPAGLISNAYIILDEVQLYQDEYYYTPELISSLVQHFTRAKIPMVMATATMPPLMEEYILREFPNPWKVSQARSQRGEVEVMTCQSKLSHLVMDLIKRGELPSDDGSALIVANTVGAAAELYRQISKHVQGARIILIHSRICDGTRDEREAALSDGNFICIATQVAESGLDLRGVKLIATELAPLDALIQRIGRCARSPAEKGKAYIALEFEEGPYPKDLLENARKTLGDSGAQLLSAALNDLGCAEELINRCYRDWKPMLPKLLRQALDNTITYVKNFGLLQQHRLGIRIRPELYITLVHLRSFLPTSAQKLGHSMLIGNAFNLSWRGSDLSKYPFLLRRENKVLELSWNSIDQNYEIQEVDKVRPSSIYILDPSWYESENGYELGLVRLRK